MTDYDYEKIFSENTGVPLKFSDKASEAIETYVTSLITRNEARERAKELAEKAKKLSEETRKLSEETRQKSVGLAKLLREEINPILMQHNLPQVNTNSEKAMTNFSAGYRNYFFRRRER